MQLPRYDSYKESGVEWIGEIPEEWDVLPYKSLFKASNERNGRNIVGEMLSVSGYRGIEVKHYEHEEQKRTEEDLKDYRVVRKGQLVVNTMWLNYAGLGVSEHDGYVSPAYRSYFIDDSLHKRFIHYLLRSHVYVQCYTGLMQGIRPNSLQISYNDFKNIQIVIPPVKDQERIASFLDQKTAEIDEAIAKKQKLIELLQEQKSILINQAVTKGLNPDAPMKDSGVEWIGEIPAHWSCSRLGHFARITNGSTPSRAEQSYWLDGTVPWLSSGAVNDYIIEKTSEYITEKAQLRCHLKRYNPGIVLVGIVGQGKTRGTSAYMTISACINQNVAAIEPGKSLDGEFLHRYLVANYDQIRRLGKGSNQEALNCELVGSMPTVIPNKPEQASIVDKIKEIETSHNDLESKYKHQISILSEYKSSLISSVVTGKIKV